MTVGERLQRYRKSLNLSQEELGQRLLVSRQTISQWETDQTLPTVDNLMRLKELFGVSIDTLLSGEEPDEQPEAKEEPFETYLFTFKDAEKKAYYSNRMFAFIKRPLILLLIQLVATVSLLIQPVLQYAALRVVLIVLLAVHLFGFLAAFLRARKNQKQIVEQIASNSYRYDFYREHFTLRVEKDGALSSFFVIPYAQITRVENADDFTFVYYNNKRALCVLRKSDLQPDSVLFRIMPHVPKKKTYRNAFGVWRAVSVISFVLAIVSLPAALWLMSAVTPAGSALQETALPNFWIVSAILLVPVTSIVIGCILKSKGLQYKKNLILGIIMTAILVSMACVSFLTYYLYATGVLIR